MKTSLWRLRYIPVTFLCFTLLSTGCTRDEPEKIKSKKYFTSEHYFQAMKFESTADQKSVVNAKTPMDAARQSRDRKKKIKRNWESIKDNVMREAVMAKFTQHDELKALLLSTGNAQLAEHTENDDYWGDGGDGSGRNMLGRILIKARDKIQL